MNDVQVAVDGACQNKRVFLTKWCWLLRHQRWESRGLSSDVCRIWKRRKGTLEYENWKVSHISSINHRKCAGAIDVEAAVAIFRSSVPRHNLQY